LNKFGRSKRWANHLPEIARESRIGGKLARELKLGFGGSCYPRATIRKPTRLRGAKPKALSYVCDRSAASRSGAPQC
jgi:hypothetical protein